MQLLYYLYPLMINLHLVQSVNNTIMCYQCKNCNKVTKWETAVSCVPSCCYTAYVADHAFDELMSIRGCLDSDECVNDTLKACDSIRDNYAVVDRCFVCKSTDVGICNGDSYIVPSVCHLCQGAADCVVPTGSVVDCTGDCCISAGLFNEIGYEMVRDCADNKESNCSTFCDEYKSLMTAYEVVTCSTCNQYKCNTDVLKARLGCYDCINCDEVNENSAQIDCISTDCCYTASVRNSPDDPYYAIRGCAPWSKNRASCDNTCTDIKTKYNDVELCTTCDSWDTTGCNGETYHPKTVCYFCLGERCTDDLHAHQCYNKCCYASSKFSSSGLINARGCVPEGIPCESYCTSFKHNLTKPDDFIYCKTCNDHKCNNEDLEVPFKCYECAHCNEIDSETPMVECRRSKCCYSSFVRDTDKGKFYAIRGCECNEACLISEQKFFQQHPLGEIDSCTVCNINDENGCNNQKYTAGTASELQPTSMVCFQCRRCNKVTYNTPTVRCPNSHCCYRAAVADNSDEPLFAVRGCVRLRYGETCDNSCDIVRRRHMLGHPEGVFHICINCVVDDSDKCNYGFFHVSPMFAMLRKSSPIRCYQCRGNCTVVTTITPNVDCPNIECCYSSLIADDSESPHYVVRGCANWNSKSNCKDTCNEAKALHLAAYPQGYFDDCVNCRIDAGSECNNHTYYIPATFEFTKPEVPGIGCYACRDCDEVTILNGMVECPDSECCYRALLKTAAYDSFFAVRACARLRRGQHCNRTCQYLKHTHRIEHPDGVFHTCITCRPGDPTGCNRKTFIAPDAVETPPPESVLCYECTNCSRVIYTTRTIRCKFAACCYSAYISNKEHTGYFYAIRGCSDGLCAEVCKDIEKEHSWQHGTGNFKKCIPCKPTDGDRCNQYNYLVSKTVPLIIPDIMCFECKRCYSVNNLTRTVHCPSPNCCYIAHLRDTAFDDIYVNRGCSKSDVTCSNTCRDVKNEHEWEFPIGSFVRCKTCLKNQRDECNNQPFMKPPITTTKQPSPYIHCYKCRNCSYVNSLTPHEECISPRCCYIVVLKNKPNEKPLVSRGCSKPEYGEQCNNTCIAERKKHVDKHPEGTLENCITCNMGETHYCNSNTYIPKKDPYIWCYKCRNCNRITSETQQEKCRFSKCCYVAIIERNNPPNIYLSRGCVHFNSQRECAKETCRHVGNQQKPLGKMTFCKPCGLWDTDYCNNNPFIPQPPTTTPAPLTTQHPSKSKEKTEHQRTSKKPLVNCYDCVNCYNLSKIDEIPEPCTSGCCYSALWSELGEITFARHCARLHKNTPCHFYCHRAKEMIYPGGTLAICKVCTTNMCNHLTYEQPPELQPTTKPMECYLCSDCDELKLGTERIACPPQCCYSSIQKDKSVRGCAKIYPGLTCDKYCGYLEKSVNATNCTICTEDRCNLVKFEPATTLPPSPPSPK